MTSSLSGKILSVRELTFGIKLLLEEGFPAVWVAGEISNYRPASSGHVYFSLKDSEAQLKAVLWRTTAQRLRFKPHDGLEVIALGRLDVYPPHGEYKLIVEELQPKGLGAAELALRQLKEKLHTLGYFDPGRKKPLPRFPRRIALVTSPTGAAVRDMLEVLGRRWPTLEVWICPVRVQGEGAAEQIAQAVKLLNRFSGIDAIVVGRGGGSAEDLGAFNAEIVAQAIFGSAIPVVSAVGHEIDVTIADLVADCRALTPSEAAERIAPNRREWQDGVRALEERLRTVVQQRLETLRIRLMDLSQRRVLRLPLERIRAEEQRLDDWGERLSRSIQQQINRLRQRLEAGTARLESLSPLNVLRRGYSLTKTEAEQMVVRSPEQVRFGDRLVTIVAHGRIVSRVEEAGPMVS